MARPYGSVAPVVVVELVGGTVVVVVDGVVDVVVDVVIWGPLEIVVAVLEVAVLDVVGVVDVEAGAAPVSGLTHPAGGVAEPCWPGMRTVPAQPKSEKVASPPDVEPSANLAVETVWRM